jgi:hypothetical protein
VPVPLSRRSVGTGVDTAKSGRAYFYVQRKNRPGLIFGAVALVALLSGSRPAALPAQETTASEPDVIAAFILNFVKFVEWPPDTASPDAPLVLCVADTAVADALDRAATRRPAGVRALEIARVVAGAAPPGCRVLFAGAVPPARLDALFATLAGRPVLTVGMGEPFTLRGGIIHLFIEAGNMRFGVNPRAAERARLRVSSHLLKLARIVNE